MRNRFHASPFAFVSFFIPNSSLLIPNFFHVQTAELAAEEFGRHFGVGYHKFPDALKADSKQFRNQAFQQIRVLHEQYFEQRVGLKSVFKLAHRKFPLFHIIPP